MATKKKQPLWKQMDDPTPLEFARSSYMSKAKTACKAAVAEIADGNSAAALGNVEEAHYDLEQVAAIDRKLVAYHKKTRAAKAGQ